MSIKIFLCSFLGLFGKIFTFIHVHYPKSLILIALVTENYGRSIESTAFEIQQPQGRSLDFILSGIGIKKNSILDLVNQTMSGSFDKIPGGFGTIPSFDTFNKLKTQTLKYFDRITQMKHKLLEQLISTATRTTPDPCNTTWSTTTSTTTPSTTTDGTSTRTSTESWGSTSSSTTPTTLSTTLPSNSSTTPPSNLSTTTTSTATTEFTLPPITYVMPTLSTDLP